jgi:uncharacterized membrane protein
MSLVACDRPLHDVAGPAMTLPTAAVLPAEDGGANYRVQLLPSLPDGRWTSAIALNNTGTVVGVGDWRGRAGYHCSVFSAAIVWNGGSMRNLHAELAMHLGLTDDPSLPTCENGGTMALDVNDAGDVLLISTLPTGDNSHFIWNAATGFRHAYFSRLGGPISLNNRDELVGYLDTGFDPSWAAYWSPSLGLRDIEPAEFGSIAIDISDDGWIVGCVRGRLARWRLDERATVLADSCGEDLGILPGVQARPIGSVARGGTAAFSALRGGIPTPLIWRRDGVEEAGWGTGAASGLSDLGRVVGWDYPVRLWEPRAVTRFRRGPAQWLPLVSSITASRAYAVNRCGEIAGHALDSSGRQRAVVWRVGRCDEG